MIKRQKSLKPKISVIIPAHNEENYIESCIKSVKSQSFKNYEIIVVDNGSNDNTSKIAANLGVKVVFEPTIGLTMAREKGRKVARGELLVYIDADTIIPPSYLSRIFMFFVSRKDVVAASNPFLFYDGDWRINTFTKIFFRNFLPIYNSILKIVNCPKIILGGNFAVRAKNLENIGGFNKNIKFYGEDTDISKRISKEGNIAFINDLYTFTSARRYNQEGIIVTLFKYFTNYFSMLILNKPILFSNSRVLSKTNNIIYKTESSDKVVSLTFDDGPNPKYTKQVLDILREENIRGTFFLIGKNVEVYPEVAIDIVKQGHFIGNHSYTHQWLLPLKTRKTLFKEVKKTEEVIYNTTGMRTQLFRPPHGIITPWMFYTLNEMGYKVVKWDNMTTDYITKTKPERIARKIVSNVKPGSIIVLHDGLNLDYRANRENAIEALKIIVKELKERGYKFSSFNEIEND